MGLGASKSLEKSFPQMMLLFHGFISLFKKTITELNLRPEQIYNADESGFIYKSIAIKTLVMESGKTAAGRKKHMERITIKETISFH